MVYNEGPYIRPAFDPRPPCSDEEVTQRLQEHVKASKGAHGGSRGIETVEGGVDNWAGAGAVALDGAGVQTS